MHIPSAFAQTDAAELERLIQAYPLGVLFSAGASGLQATPVPFLYSANNGQPVLRAHLARANPHWQDLSALTDCLILFQGTHNYVTPSWYATKGETHKVVPTWNYDVVQVRGVPTVIESAAWLRENVGALTRTMERPRAQPWQVEDAPEDFIATMLKGIVGLEVRITVIEGKRKMSQNRSAADIQGVVDGLTDPADPHENRAMAEVVARGLPKT